jgi:anti-sigma regulatory factor (Ser/Thr protein kinase)
MQVSTAADRPDRALITGLARTFPGTPESVADVRSFVAEALAADPSAADAVLMASELATNAVVHSASRLPGGLYSVEVTPTATGMARIDVIDQGPLPEAETDEPGLGAGLGIVSQLATTFGADGPDRWFTVTTEAYRDDPEALAELEREYSELEAGI